MNKFQLKNDETYIKISEMVNDSMNMSDYDVYFDVKDDLWRQISRGLESVRHTLKSNLLYD